MDTTEKEQLDKLFSPSRWSPRLNADAIIEHHVTFITEKSESAKSTVPFVTFPYGKGSAHEKLDVFGHLSHNSTILLHFSGGYWQMLSGDNSSYFVSCLHKNAFTTIIVDYDRAPRATLPEIVDQAIEAAKWALSYAKANKKCLILSGHSAGAHLCAMILSSSWFGSLADEDKQLFKGVFHLAGIFDLQPLIHTYVNDPLKMDLSEAQRNSPLLLTGKLGQNFRENEGLRRGFHIEVVVGEFDSPAFISQGKSYVQKLKEEGFESVNFAIMASKDHFNLVEDLADESDEMTQKLLTALRNW